MANEKLKRRLFGMKSKIEFQGMGLLAAGLLVIFASCASAPDFAEMDVAVQAGSFEEVLVHLDKEKETRRSIYNDEKNAILFYLDRGMVAHFAGLYQESFENLQLAEQLIEEAFTKSLTQGLATLLVNDNAREYSGQSYEDLYINVFNALNLFYMNNAEGALVEVRHLNEKLNLLADKFERTAEKYKEDQDPDQLPEMEATRFSNSALARYLGALFYRAAGNSDSARIELEELTRAFALAPEIYTNPIPSSVAEETEMPADMARLNVIAFAGLSPVKEEERIDIPLPFAAPNNVTPLALPIMVARPQAINRVEVVLNSGEEFSLELLENIGAVATETFKDEQAIIKLRGTVRAIARATAAATAGAAMENAGGALAIAGAATRIAGRVAAEASEQADVRLSRFFPNQALVGGINLEPGSYTVTVNFYGNSGLVNSQSSELEVRENGLNLARFVWLE